MENFQNEYDRNKKKPKMYFRIKRNGKWTFVPAVVYGYQHHGYTQVKDYVYMEAEE